MDVSVDLEAFFVFFQQVQKLQNQVVKTKENISDEMNLWLASVNEVCRTLLKLKT